MKAADNFRPADVTVWGITALVVWGVAILGANLSGLVPPSVYAALHAPRIQGSTLSQLRTQVEALGEDSAQMKRQNTELAQRFDLNESSTNEIGKRVGALEVSIPKLVEQQLASVQPPIDTTQTGSIGAPAAGAIADPGVIDPARLAARDAAEPAPIAPATPVSEAEAQASAVEPAVPTGYDQPLTFAVEGGTVEVRQQPLRPDAPEVTFKPLPFANAMPMQLVPDGSAMGVGLGLPVAENMAEAQWQALLGKAGTMLLGLSPILATADGTADKLIIAGPVTGKAAALDLCQRFNNLDIPCQPLPYKGEALPLLGQRF